MKKALVITAFDRLRLLQDTLESWYRVRGLEDWHVVAWIDPSNVSRHTAEEFQEFFFHRNLKNTRVHVNPVHMGVLKSPYYALNGLFDEGYDFVVRAEDDLTVSADVLEYFDWASQYFKNNPNIGNVGAWSDRMGPENWVTTDEFSPLVWGTWSDRWYGLLGPEWDMDYSTNNGTPGVEAGWDWNINRIYKREDLSAVHPLASRVQNHGVIGTHSTPDNFISSPSYLQDRGRQYYEFIPSR